MAPEVLCELFYNEKADIFSFGIILCQMIARIDADHDAVIVYFLKSNKNPI